MDLKASHYREPRLLRQRYLRLVTIGGSILLLAVPPWVLGELRWPLVVVVGAGSVLILAAATRSRR